MSEPFDSYLNPNAIQYKPQIPYFGQIVGGLTNGSLIIISGRVPLFSNKFHFNLMVGSVVSEYLKNSGDIAFHFNPRFDEQLVVRNSKEDNKWGPEEREPNAIPFQTGKEFEVMILCEQNGYKVAVNGRHYIDFKHRIPISFVGILSIGGNVEVDKIEYKREYKYMTQTYQMQSSTRPSMIPVFNPPLPYHHIFAEGLREGTMIYISGRLNSIPDRFAIDFCSGTEPFNDIAFHLNVRYRDSVVVRNTCQQNNWGPEEHDLSGIFPFAAGVNFDMIFRVDANGFMVAVNGQHFIEYIHRIPLSSVNSLRISGDLMISSIRFSEQ